MEKKMTIEDVKQYLAVVNKKRTFVELNPGIFEIGVGDGFLVRQEEFDEEATNKMNMHLHQPGRCLVFKTTYLETRKNATDYKCYFFDGDYFCVGKLFSENDLIYMQVPCYIPSPTFYELQAASSVKTTREWFKQQLRWFATEAPLFRLPLVTGALSFAEDRPY